MQLFPYANLKNCMQLFPYAVHDLSQCQLLVPYAVLQWTHLPTVSLCSTNVYRYQLLWTTKLRATVSLCSCVDYVQLFPYAVQKKKKTVFMQFFFFNTVSLCNVSNYAV